MKRARGYKFLEPAPFIVLLFLLIPQVLEAACQRNHVNLRGAWGEARFNVELAETAAQRRLGLMNRETLAGSAGMLFVYHQTRVLSFWMKDTYIPLDIIFFDETGRVVHVHPNATPLDLTSIPSQAPARYVLEINAGFAKRLGIDVGTELRHPSVLQHVAAWPCRAPEASVSE